MSASLVGSEMCIRDRPGPSPVRESSIACPWLRAHALCAHTPLRRGSRAVSYTHLTLPTICSV
eukprot:9159006-Alexandrium_andersonii.AAC.1